MDQNLARAPGLPKNGDSGRYFAFDDRGDCFAIEWSTTHNAWVGSGFREAKYPTQVVFRGDAERSVVSHVATPLHLIDLPEAKSEISE